MSTNDNDNTKIAVIQTDIGYIKRAMEDFRLIFDKITLQYVTKKEIEDLRVLMDRVVTQYATKDDLKVVDDKVNSVIGGIKIVLTAIVLAIVGALLSLVIKK